MKVNEFNETKAIRDYDIFLIEGAFRCDYCKRFFMTKDKGYELVPSARLTNFDSLFLCGGCVGKCKFDVKEGVLNGLGDE